MKDIEAAWRRGYAKQAVSDLEVYTLLTKQEDIPNCHWLHYLQMCLEKAAKAHLWQSSRRPERSDRINVSHKFIEKALPQVFREFWLQNKSSAHGLAAKLQKVRHLCRELDSLGPRHG